MINGAERLLAVAVFVLSIVSGNASAQTWQPLQNQPAFDADTPLLLTDGTIMVRSYGTADWWRLTPDSTGSYVNGTWSQMASMPSSYLPLYHAAAVLPDGRVIIEGGEYLMEAGAFHAVWTTKGAIYDPVTNSWRSVLPPSGWTSIGDAQSVVLANGQFMLANCCTKEAALLDPVTLTWTPTGAGKVDKNDEEGWTLLPDGSVLTLDANNLVDLKHAEKYVGGSWLSAGSTLNKLNTTNKNGGGDHEIGPAMLRPDGTVFATGATRQTAIYHPPAVATDPGTWTKGPVFPNIVGEGPYDIADGPAALMPNGNVLMAASPKAYKAPIRMFEYRGGKTMVEVPRPPNAVNDSSFFAHLLPLPNGQILFADGSNDVEIYTPTGGPNAAWAPTVSSVSATLTHGTSDVISGTLFNGMSEASAYGDDAQSSTNYPLVRITHLGTGHVAYARTFGHSSMAVGAHGTVSTNFTVPNSIDLGASTLEVVANGIASAPVSVTVQ